MTDDALRKADTPTTQARPSMQLDIGRVWHLFPMAEAYKLDTFLAGRCWCACLNAFPSFSDDEAIPLPKGEFASCWHASSGNPTTKAWTIFGGSGDGIAIATTAAKIDALVRSVQNENCQAAFSRVSYIRAETLGSNEHIPFTAFLVAMSHQDEREERLAVRVHGYSEFVRGMRSRAKAQLGKITIPASPPKIEPIEFLAKTDKHDEAVLLPIWPESFIEEILIGPLVTNEDRAGLTLKIGKGGVAHKIREIGSF